jgi:hypothetical protein
MKKTLMSLIVLGMTVTGSAGVYAGTKLEQISAYLNHDITFKINGQAHSFTDSNGKTLTPITYQNVTYLPLRAVSNALDVQVTYDATHSQISLGSGQKDQNNNSNEELSSVTYNDAQLKVIKKAFAQFDGFETAYAPGQMIAGDAYVNTVATGDGVNLTFKNIIVNVSPRDYSDGYDSKKVKLSNGVEAKWYTPSSTPMLSFQLDDRTVTISSPNGKLNSAQIEKVAVTVAKLK